jgi:cation transport regulator
MLDDDVTGIINTILDYSINSASETKYLVENESVTMEKLFNIWLENVNVNINGVPTGLQELSKEYYKERWSGSSLCLMKVQDWKNISFDGTTISVPMTLYFVNGSSVYVKRENEKEYKLGSDKYSLNEAMKSILGEKKNEDIVVQKPFDRWFTKYPTPYLVRKGVLKNYLAIKTIQSKADEVISKVLPYLFVIEKGTQELFNRGVDYKDKELEQIVTNLKTVLEKYKTEKDRTPAHAVPFDQKYSHLIPDLRNILTEELYRQGYRALLSGLGFVDVIQGISNTRRESVLNPKPFIAEVNAGVDGFKSILLDVINLIIKENKLDHRKLFSDVKPLKIVNSPIRINVEELLESIRSGYDRGVLSIQSYIESLGFDFDKERERRQKELDNALEDLFYPHLIQNREDVPDRMIPSKPRNEKNEDQNKKKNTPESKNFQAEIEEAESKYIRLRQREPSEFEEDSFKIIWLSKSKGIKAVIGRLKGEKTTTIQSYLFDKEKWTEEEAKKWVKEHGGKVEASLEYILSVLEEDLEIAPYQTLEDLPKAVKKYPEHAQKIWKEAFNSAYKSGKGEAYAFRVAWSALQKYMNKQKGEKK